MSDKKWAFYIIHNQGATYAGVSPDPVRRLRQHNGEIVGGAKYTTGKGPGWEHICLVRGFQDKIHSMQFEWAVKHVAPRNAGGLVNRIKKLYTVLNKPKWTSKAPDANTVPLILEWKQPVPCEDRTTPDYIVDLHFLNNPPENP